MITTIIGTRPEIIKMSRLIPLLDKIFDHKFILTGQHYSKEMVDIFLEELGVRQPDQFLNAKSSEYSHILPVLKDSMKNDNSDYVLVYGDTNSTLAATLAAQKTQKKLIHVEAGLRSYDSRMSEELVRVLVDHLSEILFPPTQLTASFLEKEGIINNVYVVGNTGIDACLAYSELSDERSTILEKLNLKGADYIFSTIHRSENVDKPTKLLKILNSLSTLPFPVILPLHHRTKLKLDTFGFKIPTNITAIDSVGYLDSLQLLKHAKFVVTDSGGIQEEAITLKVPCITLRETTERWETISLGANFLTGSDHRLINYNAKMILDTNLKAKIEKMENPYGDGKASERITNILLDKLKK